jgi:transposase
LKAFFLQPTREDGEAFLKRWYFLVTHSRLDPIIQAAKTIKRHWEGILNWFESRITIGILEGFNSLIQAAKTRARRSRSMQREAVWGAVQSWSDWNEKAGPSEAYSIGYDRHQLYRT